MDPADPDAAAADGAAEGDEDDSKPVRRRTLPGRGYGARRCVSRSALPADTQAVQKSMNLACMLLDHLRLCIQAAIMACTACSGRHVPHFAHQSAAPLDMLHIWCRHDLSTCCAEQDQAGCGLSEPRDRVHLWLAGPVQRQAQGPA